MPCKVDEYDNAAVLTPTLDLAGDEVGELRKRVDDLIDHKQRVDLVVDLENCSFVDSEGLELLLEIRRRCDELFGQMRMVGLDENLKKVLEMTRLEPRFDCRPDLSTALKTMK
jgi:anti-sigma B factor antagonist